jgi:hypothetical protein
VTPPDGSDLSFAATNNLACTRAVFEATPFDESYPRAAGEDRDGVRGSRQAGTFYALCQRHASCTIEI